MNPAISAQRVRDCWLAGLTLDETLASFPIILDRFTQMTIFSIWARLENSFFERTHPL